MTSLSLHPIARFVIQSRQRNSQLQEKSGARGKLLLEIQYAPAGVFDATHAEVSEHDYKQKEQSRADHQRHQRRIETRFARWTGAVVRWSGRHAAVDCLAFGGVERWFCWSCIQAIETSQ